MDWNMLSNYYHNFYTSFQGFQGSIFGKSCWYKDDGRIDPMTFTCRAHTVVYWDTFDSGTALARGSAGDNLAAISDHLLSMANLTSPPCRTFSQIIIEH